MTNITFSGYSSGPEGRSTRPAALTVVFPTQKEATINPAAWAFRTQVMIMNTAARAVCTFIFPPFGTTGMNMICKDSLQSPCQDGTVMSKSITGLDLSEAGLPMSGTGQAVP